MGGESKVEGADAFTLIVMETELAELNERVDIQVTNRRSIELEALVGSPNLTVGEAQLAKVVGD
jgi:hypothetical protein